MSFVIVLIFTSWFIIFFVNNFVAFSFLDILDEREDLRVHFQRVHVSDVSINEPVCDAFPRVRQNLVVQLCRALINFATLGDVVNDLLVEDVELSHLLVDLREVLHILSRVLGIKAQLLGYLDVLRSKTPAPRVSSVGKIRSGNPRKRRYAPRRHSTWQGFISLETKNQGKANFSNVVDAATGLT